PDQSWAPSASITFTRARSLSSGATASSRSRNTKSAPRVGAFSIARSFVPGTASSLRCSRALSAILFAIGGGPLARHDGVERGEHLVGGLAVRVHAHQPDSPDRRRRRPQPAADLQ